MVIEGQLLYVPSQPQSAPCVDNGTDDPEDAYAIQQQLRYRGSNDKILEAFPCNLRRWEACAHHEVLD